MGNLSDCIKVACDFVTFSSIETCISLREQFRSEQREDVLQIQTMLWYSWLAVSQALASKPQMDYMEPPTISKALDFMAEVRICLRADPLIY